MAIAAIPIQPVKSLSGNQWASRRIIEEAAQTFKIGTPLMLKAADGGLQAWDGTAGAGHLIAGISYEAASNLATTGKGAPTPNTPVLGIGSAITFGNVQNEPLAVNIPHGAPFNDGRVGVVIAAADTIFSATFGNAGVLATPLNTDVGVQYGMTIDTLGNFWYVDKSKTAANAVVLITGLDLRDPAAVGARVLFQFIAADASLLG
jgi:hypothetical protein